MQTFAAIKAQASSLFRERTVSAYFTAMVYKDPETQREYMMQYKRTRTPAQRKKHRNYMRERRKTHSMTPAQRERANNYRRECVMASATARLSTDDAKVKARERRQAATAKSRSRPFGNDLYVIECSRFPGEYKVGRAADPHYRAEQLSHGMPCYFKVSKVYEGHGKYETLVHNALASFMVKGEKSKNEWFCIPYDDLIDKIEEVLLVVLF